MNLLLLLSVCVAGIHAAPNDCIVRSWHEWSQCHGTHFCNPEQPKTAPVSDEIKALGNGRNIMKEMMQEKIKLYHQKAECLGQKSCPQLSMKNSTGSADCVDGFAGEYPCRNVDLLSFISLEDLGYGDDIPREDVPAGNDIWVWHDTDNGDDYAVVGTTGGSSMVRITDPLNPEVLGFLPTQTFASVWRDMKVVNNHAFIGSEADNHGIQVFDLTQLRGLTANKDRRFTTTVHYAGVGQSHNVASNPENNRIFVVGATNDGGGIYTPCAGGLHIVDVSDPQNPTFAGCFDEDGYTHDAQCAIYPTTAPHTEYHGHEICFCYNEDTFTIVDTTDAASPVMLSRMAYTNSRYTHQGWSTEDFTLNLLDDELDEYFTTDKYTKTYVWNISNLTNPILHNVYKSTETSIDHNLYIVGKYAHQSNYEAGYRLLEIDFATSLLSEVAYFDVFPSGTTAEFRGTWSNYPWLPNDVVVLTSIDYGMYLLKVDYAAIEAQKAQGSSYGEMSRYREAVYGESLDDCPPLVQKQVCSPPSC